MGAGLVARLASSRGVVRGVFLGDDWTIVHWKWDGMKEEKLRTLLLFWVMGVKVLGDTIMMRRTLLYSDHSA